MAFNLPIQNIYSRKIQPGSWVRPSDWPVITDTANEVQFLMSDIGNASCTVKTQFTRVSGSQNIIIDWGDGTSNTISSTALISTNHYYTPGTGTPCSGGYTTFKIRVYFTGTGTSTITTCRIHSIILSGSTAISSINCGVLEMYHGDETMTSGSMSNYYYSNTTSTTNSLGGFANLKYVKLSNKTTSLSSAFYNCHALAVVEMSTSMSLLSTLINAFFGCYSLEYFHLPSDAVNIISFNAAFSNCFRLKSVKLPTTLNACANFANAFSSCGALKNITLPPINTASQMGSMFSTCTSLEWVKFEAFPTVPSVTMTSIFTACSNLKMVYLPSSVSPAVVFVADTMFQTCTELTSFTFPVGFNASTLANTFNNCTKLFSAVFQSGCPSLTTLQGTFAGCTNIKNITLPATAGSSVSLQSTFATCTSLEYVKIPNAYNCSTLSNTFNGCRSLKTIDWTPGAQNSITNMTSAYADCEVLENINLPTSLNGVTLMNSAFRNCRALRSIVFPPTMNSVTGMNSCFINCYLLESITMPTSTTACNDFANICTWCISLTSFTFPATINAANTTGLVSAFFQCSSLTTVTFHTSPQLSSITSLDSLFASCGNLRTINNFDKIGSLTATPLIACTMSFVGVPYLSFSGPLSTLNLSNIAVQGKNYVRGVRFLNTSAGQWTGSTPQINLSYTDISYLDLITTFNDIAAQGNVGAGKGINVTGATGAAGLTAADRLIVTSKGWTLTG